MEGTEYYKQLLRDVFDGRQIIVCADTLVGGGAVAKSFEPLGVKRPLIVSGGTGTGALPTEDEADIFLCNTSGASTMGTIRAFEEALVQPSAALLTAIDTYDPDRTAIVIGTLFSPDTMWDRQTFGGRPATWAAIEDKLVVDEICDAAGVARAPSEIVAATEDELRRASTALDHGLGTAWAGDTKEGWWGGGEYFRWVRSDEHFADAASFFGAHCDRVRVMPFLEGIPCSIHGVVFADTVATFRPVEMLTLRHPDQNKLHYSGLATYFDPPAGDREEMREAARRIGAHLRDRVAYRGMFTLDGVMSEDGFRPTEINARPGAGISPQSAAAGLNVAMISNLIAQRPDLDYRPRDLEALVIDAADATRAGSCYTTYPSDPPLTETTTIDVGADTGLPDGSFLYGPSGVGGFVRFQPDTTKVSVGPSFAPTAVKAFAYSDAHHNTNLGPLEAARSVR